MKLISLRSHRYGGTLRRPGDIYDANLLFATALVAVGHAAKYQTGDAAPERPAAKATKEPPATPEKPRRKRVYKRRDMRAED